LPRLLPAGAEGLRHLQGRPPLLDGAAPMIADERLPASLYAFAGSLVFALIVAVAALVVLA
jgi:hypothetical protein